MDEFEQKIAWTISTYGLIPRKDMKIIVGLSGGADSVALLTALHRLGYTCTAAHCNFHLRGEESMRDMHHAISITQNLGIDLSIKHFDVPERQRQTGESIEMACRSLRYCWFTRLLEDTQSAAIAIAHHSGDNIETFFLNLLRGTGLTGLTGIRHRNGTVIRPMLDCTRLEAEQYLARTHTQYITDSSNLTNEYKRNRLRNIILPQIEESFPGATGAISHTMDCLKESAAFYNEMVEEKRRQYFNPSTSSFDLQALSAEPSARLLLFEWLRPMGFNATHATRILESASRTGATFTAGEAQLLIDRGQLIITTTQPAATQATFPVSLNATITSPAFITVTTHPITEFNPTRDPNTIYLDAAILEGNHDIQLRHWRKGDTIEPFGMGGRRKKVSDIFTDAKLPLHHKQSAWLLTIDGHIVWILGLRASRRFAVTPSTRSYIRLQWRGRLCRFKDF